MVRRVRRRYLRLIVSWSRRAILFAVFALLLERWIERATHSTVFELASVARGVPPGSYALQRIKGRANSLSRKPLPVVARVPKHLCLRTSATVSPRTAAAIASYARMHRSAIRTLKLRAAGGMAMEALRGSSMSSPRVLVYTANPAAGLGNRINGLLSSFVLALATGRILLLDMPIAHFGEQDGEKLGMPVGINSLFHSPFGSAEDSLSAARGEVTEGEWDFSIVSSVLPHGLPEATVHVRMLHELCDANIFEYDAPVLRVQSSKFFAPLLLSNPAYRDSLRRAFDVDDASTAENPDETSLFFALSAALLRPVPALCNRIQAYISRNFESATNWVGHREMSNGGDGGAMGTPFVVGLQVRGGVRGFAWNLVDNGTHIACLRDVVEQAGAKRAGRPVRVFVASDSTAVRDSAVTAIHKLFGHGAALTLRNSTAVAGRDTAQGQHDALVDLYLLASCDALVVSPMSTFGAAAAGLANRVPHVVRVGNLASLKRKRPQRDFRGQRFCTVGLSAEPCMHLQGVGCAGPMHAPKCTHALGLLPRTRCFDAQTMRFPGQLNCYAHPH